MKIIQFRYGEDNLGYLIYEGGEAVVIDGGAVENILSYARQHGLEITHAANTHSHPDHTMGTQTLVDKTGAKYLDYKTLIAERKIPLAGKSLDIYPTPGHTRDSVTFAAKGFLVTGDTLFNGTVGNCFSGDLDSFHKSITFLLTFPENTIVYAGHDYVVDAIAVARQFEPFNPDHDAYMEKYDPSHVRYTLADEKKVDPYLRFNEQPIIDLLRKKNLPVDTELNRWKSVMSL